MLVRMTKNKNLESFHSCSCSWLFHDHQHNIIQQHLNIIAQLSFNPGFDKRLGI